MQNKIFIFLQYKVSEQTLKSDNVAVNKKEFHSSKQAIASDLMDANKIVVSEKLKYSDDGSKYFTGYLH